MWGTKWKVAEIIWISTQLVWTVDFVSRVTLFMYGWWEMWPVYTAEKVTDSETETGFQWVWMTRKGALGAFVIWFEYEHMKMAQWKCIKY